MGWIGLQQHDPYAGDQDAREPHQPILLLVTDGYSFHNALLYLPLPLRE